jgi:hypothetical protein
MTPRTVAFLKVVLVFAAVVALVAIPARELAATPVIVTSSDKSFL